VIQDGRVPKPVEPMVLLVLRVDVSDLMRHSKNENRIRSFKQGWQYMKHTKNSSIVQQAKG